MNNLKIATLIIMTLFTLSVSAGEWHHLQLNQQIQLSYTVTTLSATYGAEGGAVAGIFYVDVNTLSPAKIETVAIYSGTNLVTTFPLFEDFSTHFYGKAKMPSTYADFLYLSRPYVIEVVIDGRIERFNFKLQ